MIINSTLWIWEWLIGGKILPKYHHAMIIADYMISQAGRD